MTEHNQETIESLVMALEDYKEKISNQVSLIAKQSETTERLVKNLHHTEDFNQISPTSNIYEYVMKREMPTMLDGLAFIPYPSYLSDSKNPLSLMRLGKQITQNSGVEHLLLTMPRIELQDALPEVFKIPYPLERRLVLHDIQAEIDLLPQSISGHSPLNFNDYLINTLERVFTLMENQFFISDNGIPNKIDGIGNLNGAEKLEIEYQSELDILPILHSMISSLPTQYHQGAVWFTSPEIMGAMRNILDSTGRTIVSDDLLGFPVYCHPGFNKTTCKIILSNPQSGYAMISYPGLLADYNMTHDRKYIKYYFNRMVSGAVTDSHAWVSLAIKNMPALKEIKFKSFGPKI